MSPVSVSLTVYSLESGNSSCPQRIGDDISGNLDDILVSAKGVIVEAAGANVPSLFETTIDTVVLCCICTGLTSLLC
jgi:hypothetical protein